MGAWTLPVTSLRARRWWRTRAREARRANNRPPTKMLCPTCAAHEHRAWIRAWRVDADLGRCEWGHVSTGQDIYRHNQQR